MTQASISRIERDRVSPSLATLERILGAMGETLQIDSVPVTAPPVAGGNATIGDLRSEFDELTPDQHLEQAMVLSRTTSELAASRPQP